MRRVTHERYISQSQWVNCDLARRYMLDLIYHNTPFHVATFLISLFCLFFWSLKQLVLCMGNPLGLSCELSYMCTSIFCSSMSFSPQMKPILTSFSSVSIAIPIVIYFSFFFSSFASFSLDITMSISALYVSRTKTFDSLDPSPNVTCLN